MPRPFRLILLAVLVVGVFGTRSLLLSRFGSTKTHHVQGSSQPVSFTTASVKDAANQAAQSHKVLVVDAMAQWCGPCKRMEKDSWSNLEVEAWMKENAVFVQVDVDADQDTSRLLEIEAMPTVIVFKDGRELKRSVGYLSAGELLNWLKDG